MKVFLPLIFLGSFSCAFAQVATIKNHGGYVLKACLCTNSNCSNNDFVCTLDDAGSGYVCSCSTPVKCHSGIDVLEKATFAIPQNCPAIAVYTEILGRGEGAMGYGKFPGNGGYMKAGTTVTLTGAEWAPGSNFNTTPPSEKVIQKK